MEWFVLFSKNKTQLQKFTIAPEVKINLCQVYKWQSNIKRIKKICILNIQILYQPCKSSNISNRTHDIDTIFFISV